jgi:hypothetical protein
MTMPTSKPLFNEFTARKKYRVPSWNFVGKNVLCEKGDEITRFDGTLYTSAYLVTSNSENSRTQKNPGWLFLWGFQILEMFLLQSIQSAMLSVQSSELGPPSPASKRCSPLGSKGGANSLAGEGVGDTIPTKGQMSWYMYSILYSLYTVLTLLSKTLAEFHFAQKICSNNLQSIPHG